MFDHSAGNTALLTLVTPHCCRQSRSSCQALYGSIEAKVIGRYANRLPHLSHCYRFAACRPPECCRVSNRPAVGLSRSRGASGPSRRSVVAQQQDSSRPPYRQAEQQFTHQHQLSKALYARVSQMPAHSESSTSIPSQIALHRTDLDLPEAKNPETCLRIVTILGMLEVNYDSGTARQTWREFEALTLQRRHLLLASRAMGEQGITVPNIAMSDTMISFTPS
jgi:hypothetical protein